MKKIIFIFLCFLYITSYGYNTEKFESEFIIGKIVGNEFFMIDKNGYEDLSKLEKNNKNYIKLNYDLTGIENSGNLIEKLYGNGIMLKNTFFLNKDGIITEEVNKNIIKKLKDNNGLFHNGDIVVFQTNSLFDNEKVIKNILGKNILISLWGGNTSSIFEKAYKIKCNNDIFDILEFDGGIETLSKNKIKNNLKINIKTCENFNKMFDIKYNYKNNKDYSYKLNRYKLSINKRFGKILSKITGDKLTKLLEKIEKLREEKNNDKTLSQDKKDNINILLDALIENLK